MKTNEQTEDSYQLASSLLDPQKNSINSRSLFVNDSLVLFAGLTTAKYAKKTKDGIAV